MAGRFVFTFVFTLTAVSGFTQLDGLAPLSKDRMVAIVEQYIQKEDFSGTVLIADQGRIVYQHTQGFADPEQQQPLNDSTHFGIASITKMLTAIVVLQLVDAQQLRLEQSLQELLPNLEIPKAKRITVHHLLLHLSGLPNEPLGTYLESNRPEQYVKLSLEKGPQKGKFEKFNYNNLDYVLLGLVIEKLTGRPWQEVITERIIYPLNLHSTGFLKKGNYPDNFAFSYQRQKDGSDKKDPAIYIQNFYAAGNMYSTAADLLKIDQALYSDQLLSEQARKLLYHSYPEFGYAGYSVWTYNYPFAESQPRVMERRGGILGANSVICRLPDYNRTLIILTNNGRFNPDSFGDQGNLKEALLVELGKKE